MASKYPQQCTLDGGVFVTPDVVISTTNASVVHITANGTIVDVRLHEAHVC